VNFKYFLSCLFCGSAFLAGSLPTLASESPVVAEFSTDPSAQLTSVSQLSDVQPTDWAFQALRLGTRALPFGQSLVERYDCIAGSPNATFDGNRALTRYDFAARLKACLDRVNELIATGTSSSVLIKNGAGVHKPLNYTD